MEARRLSTWVGISILAATTNCNVLQTGGWLTSHAILVAALSAGVFAGARVVGLGAGKMGLIIVAALVAGELFNFSATAERIVIERENGAAPLKDAMAKHNQAVTNLNQLENADPMSPRVKQARADKKAADDAVTKEASDGCKSECRRKQDLADKAQQELVSALAEAEQIYQGQIESAQAEVDASPLPASATPLADRLNIPAWSLDLIMAALLSVGANGLAGTLIAYGSHGKEEPNIVPTRSFHVSSIPVPVGTPPKGGNRGARSDYQVRANMIARELRENGIEPRFRVVKSEFERQHGKVPPNVTIHRACRN